MNYKKIVFPADEMSHNNIIEWWYFNGNLVDKHNQRYAFMDCLFKTNPKKVKIPIIKRVPLKNAYFHHSILAEVKTKKFTSEVHPLVVISKDSFTKERLFVNYTSLSLGGYLNYVIEKINDCQYRIKTQLFDLTLTNNKLPLLVGGKGFLDLGVNSTFYYSLTNLSINGEVVLNNRRVPVKGLGWMDHQWADAVYDNFKWSWFSIQLKNDVEIIAFIFIGQDKKEVKLASMILKNGNQQDFFDVEINQIGQTWQSSKTGSEYFLTWQLKIKSAGIDLHISPVLEKQEVIFGSINYWEGPIEVTGTLAGRKTIGQGFMELVGSPSKRLKLGFQSHKFNKKLATLLKRSI